MLSQSKISTQSKIYTKKGDSGETFCPGAVRAGSGGQKNGPSTSGLKSGQPTSQAMSGRVKKDDAQIEAIGGIDELNSFVGLAISFATQKPVRDILDKIQEELLCLGAEVAASPEAHSVLLSQKRITALEKEIDKFSNMLPRLRNFILPGGSKAAAALQVCRVVARRAERRCVTIKKILRPQTLAYLNRLSDLFFVLARFENCRNKVDEKSWSSGKAFGTQISGTLDK